MCLFARENFGQYLLAEIVATFVENPTKTSWRKMLPLQQTTYPTRTRLPPPILAATSSARGTRSASLIYNGYQFVGASPFKCVQWRRPLAYRRQWEAKKGKTSGWKECAATTGFHMKRNATCKSPPVNPASTLGLPTKVIVPLCLKAESAEAF